MESEPKEDSMMRQCGWSDKIWRIIIKTIEFVKIHLTKEFEMFDFKNLEGKNLLVLERDKRKNKLKWLWTQMKS